MFVLYEFLGRRSFIDPICCNSCMVLSMFFRLLLANSSFSLREINLTVGLLPPRRHVVWRDSVGVNSSGSGLKIRVRGYFSSEFSLVVAPYWQAPKQLSMATIPLCFEFFRCRVDVLQSSFSRSTIQHCSILLAEFNMSTLSFLLIRSL